MASRACSSDGPPLGGDDDLPPRSSGTPLLQTLPLPFGGMQSPVRAADAAAAAVADAAAVSSPPSAARSSSIAPPPQPRLDMFSWNCREELDGHVNCVKLFLEEHVKYGTPYAPGTGTADDHCHPTRNLYMRCMQARQKNPVSPQDVQRLHHRNQGPKPCEMELSMHGSCVARQLERTQKLGEKYWTEGGEDRCLSTRANYERCMYKTEQGATDNWHGDQVNRELEKNVQHLQVRLTNK